MSCVASFPRHVLNLVVMDSHKILESQKTGLFQESFLQ